jgi:hypothetical protein
MSQADPFEIRPGNTLVVLESILKRKGTDGVLAVRDLTSSTSVKFSMVNAATGVTTIDEEAATIVTANAGLVRFTFSEAQVETPGIYHYTWTEYVNTAYASYPVRTRDGVIWIHSATQTAQQAYQAALEA